MKAHTASLTLSAPAKINLSLKILGKREDGYHELDTLMQKVALYDELNLTLTDEPGVRVRCLNAELPEDEGNIAVRAAQLFLAETGNSDQGVDIVLKKNIPAAAGLGGGSSDAAAVLNGLNQLLRTGCPKEQLAETGVRLGADVPLFIYDFPAARAAGIGERLVSTPPLSGYRILLVNPGVPVSTEWAYTAFSSAAEKIALTANKKEFSLFCPENGGHNFPPEVNPARKFTVPDDLRNDLETVTAQRYPVIRDIKEGLLACGAAGAMMSGSGSTVFGLFRREAEDRAEQCRNRFQREYDHVSLISPLVKEET